MKKVIYLCLSLVLLSTSCIESGLDDFPEFEDAEISDFDLEYRFVTTNANGVEQLAVKKLSTSLVIDDVNNTIEVSPTVPGTTTTFTAEERANVTLTSIVGYAKISTAAKITPVGSAPSLGKPGDYSAAAQYEVSAADGKTKKTWTITVNPLVF